MLAFMRQLGLNPISLKGLGTFMASATKGLDAGDKAPKFKLATDDGQTVSSGTLKGQPYIVYFYPKDDTSGCTKQAIGFSAALAKFTKLGIPVIGVSKDSLASHEKFRKKHKLKIALGSDPDIVMAEGWGVWLEKSLYGRKYMGMERATFLVDAKGVIARAWHKVKVPGHVEAVLEAAKSL
jgi:peroxiredoxin Q/BCP